MPHIIVKLWPGRAEETKQNLADKIASDVAEEFNISLDDISVAFEEVAREDWDEVYRRDICEKRDTLYKKPGY